MPRLALGAALLALLASGGCAPSPHSALPGLLPVSQRPCLAPPLAGEPDPALRDLRLRLADGSVTVEACVVSSRYERFEELSLEIAVLSDTGTQGRYLRLGNGTGNVRPLQGLPPGGAPRLVVLLSDHAVLPRGFTPRLTDMAAVRLTWRGCRHIPTAPCLPDPTPTTQPIVPVRLEQ